MRSLGFVVLVAVMMVAERGLGQDNQSSTAPSPAQAGQLTPAAGQPVPVAEPAATPGSQAAAQGRGIEYGAHLFSPFFVKGDDIGLGAGIQGRIGWEFAGGLTLEASVGLMGNSVDSDFAAGLTNLWFGGGARYAFLNPSAIVPFVAASLTANIWTPCDEGEGRVICEGDSDLRIGALGAAGAAFEINRNAAVEAGIHLGITDVPDLPGRPQVWVAPFVGGTLYY